MQNKLRNEVPVPLIYNLFPRLVGKINEWEKYIYGIKSMGFNWIYINPINEMGLSGSLYSIKNYFKIDPIFAKNMEDQKSWKSFIRFVQKCHDLGIKVMIDLVINHTAIDSVDEHPNWYEKKWIVRNLEKKKIVGFFNKNNKPSSEKFPSNKYSIKWQIANSYAINPDNSNDLQVWGDLAKLDFNSPSVNDILNFIKKYLDFNIEMGVDGFRCDAAYQIPPNVWNKLISYLKNKKQNPNSFFWAETLGATLPQYDKILTADFDFITSSDKWWDYTKPWCVNQYNKFRKFAPSISFPENHDTTRLAKDSGNRIDIQKFKYFFSAFFSAGLSITIGYEYGFKKKTHVVNTTPDDWEMVNFDISDYIKKVNDFKLKFRCLQQDGEIKHFNYHDLGILVIRKSSLDTKQQILLIYNKDWNKANHVIIDNLQSYFKIKENTTINPIYKLSIENKQVKKRYFEKNFIKDLDPNEFHLFMITMN